MRRRPSAYTLVEVLVWLAVLAVFISLVSWFMVSVMDATRRGRRAVETATVRIMVLERLGADVRSCVRIVGEHAGRKTGEETVILETPGSERIIYRFGDGVLYRETTVDGGACVVPLGRLDHVRFRCAGEDPAASRWLEVEMPGGTGTGLTQRFYLLETEAAP